MEGINQISEARRFFPLHPQSSSVGQGGKSSTVDSNPDLWWPPNKGILYKGEQKLTREKLLKEIEARNKKVSKEELAKLKKACQDFESFFVYYLLKVMDKTVPHGEGILGDSRPTQFYRDMFYEDLANEISRRGMGLADVIYSQAKQYLLNRVYPKSSPGGGR